MRTGQLAARFWKKQCREYAVANGKMGQTEKLGKLLAVAQRNAKNARVNEPAKGQRRQQLWPRTQLVVKVKTNTFFGSGITTLRISCTQMNVKLATNERRVVKP